MQRILIVDDEIDNIELLNRRLTRRGYAILSATNAADGIQIAQDEQPDIILMDVKMPVMDGLAATRLLKQNPATQAIPVITLTAHAMVEDREMAIASGADEFEIKPVDLQLLLEKIEKLLTPKD